MRNILIFVAAFFMCAPAQATGVPASQSEEPLEITADGTLEWKRNEKTFVAQENAIAKQGDVSIAAAILIANYRESKASDMEIYRVTADGTVVVRSKESAAYGDHAVYNLDEGLAVMTGGDLRMVSPDQTVTARESFEYWVTDGRLTALGAAKVVRPKPTGGTDTLQADKIVAVLKDDAQGRRVLDSLEATGNVVITTPEEVVTGSRGVYKAKTNKAELSGNVKITRGPNVLEGSRAEVDMNTNTSRLFGGGAQTSSTGSTTTSTGRVRGVFYPGSEKKPEITPVE